MSRRSILAGLIPFLLSTQVSLAPRDTVPAESRRSFLTRALALPPEVGALLPLGLASADLDEDGVPDLVSAHGDANGSLLVIRFGNVDSIHPHSPEAQRRKEEGTFHEGPFLPGSRHFPVTGRADFVVTGDFDADGHMDVLTAGSGSGVLALHAGDGRGALGESRNLSLPGVVTALAAGEVNRADGLMDLVMGVDGPDGPAAVVLEGPSGAFEAVPETVALPARAERIDLVRLDDDIAIDMTVGTRGANVIIRGRDRTSADPGEAIVEILPQEDLGTRLPEDRAPRGATGLTSPAGSDNPAATLEMRLNRDAIPDRVILTRSGLTIEMSSPVETFTVTSVADDGSGSLREAIIMANENEGPDWIVFDIPGPGPHTIEPLTPLGEITDAVTIDGTTQPGFEGLPAIELSGAELDPESSGLVVFGGPTAIRGLALTRFSGRLFEGGAIVLVSPDNIVEGNHVGVDTTGLISRGNTVGIHSFLENNLIGGTTPSSRNLVSGNEFAGILALYPGPTQVRGNYIGTDWTGTLALPNEAGVYTERGNEIGGLVPGAGNLISGNHTGVASFKGGGNLVQANLIGTDASGRTALGNGYGMYLAVAASDTIGATTPTGGNVISGNLWGVTLYASMDVHLQGNHIGTGPDGATAVPNGTGLEILGSRSLLIGGDDERMRNVISGNGIGVWIQENNATDNIIQGNYMGTDVTGSSALSNNYAVLVWGGSRNRFMDNLISANTQIGIGLFGGEENRVQGNVIGLTAAGEPLSNAIAVQIGGANRNLVGGDTVEEGNIIAHNGHGVFVAKGTGNTIRSNSIHSNGYAIYLQGETHRFSDYYDLDVGPNDLQNFPFFFDNACGDARGVLQSEPIREFILDFYASDRCDPGNPEGKTPLGSMTVRTDSRTDGLFSFPLPPEAAPGQFITVTATNHRGSTSELSECALVVPAGCARPVARLAKTVFECTESGGGLVTWDATPSTDTNSTPGTNDDIVSFEWFSIHDFEDLPNRGRPVLTGETVEVGTFPLGEFQYPFVLLVTDSTGLLDYIWFDVEVVDTAPPLVDVPMEPAILWPPNHRMVEVSALLDDRDVCASSTTRLVSVSSSEPDDLPGGADGTTVDDIQGVVLGSRDIDFLLRAERSGGGEGRAYSLTYESTDENGNSTLTTAVVLVPHDMGGVTEPVMLDVAHNGEGTVLSWADVPGAIHYNVVQGDVANLKRSSKSFHLGNMDCLASETILTSVAAAHDPAPGQAHFYLVEYDDGLPSGFGTESAAKDRFAPSGQACP